MKKIIFIILIIFILNACSLKTEKKEEENIIPARENHYKTSFQNQYGGLLKNKTIEIKKIRDNIMINFPEIANNINILEPKKLDPKEINIENIKTALNLNKESKKEFLKKEKFNILYIPLIYPENEINLGEFSNIQINALEQYAAAIKEYDIPIDFVKILENFNSEMQIELNFDKNESLDFIEIYAKKIKEKFNTAQIIISIDEMLCYYEYALQAEDKRCLVKENSENIWDQWEFIKNLEERKIAYDIIGYKYYPSLDHSSLFADFEKIFDDLRSTGKKIYIEEFFVPGNEPLKEFIKNKPDNGWSPEFQKNFIKKTLGYIDYYPEMVGINYVIKKRNEENTEIYGEKIYPIEKISHSIIKEWQEKTKLSAKLKTDTNGFALLPLTPGKYEFKLNWRTKKIITIDDKQEITIKFD